MTNFTESAEKKIELTQLQAHILELIQIGKDNAIRLDDLKKRTGVSDRKVRLAIEDLRRQKWAILSTTKQPSGYYLAQNQAEVDECLHMMRNYIIELCKTRRNIKLGSLERLQRHIQLPMLIGGK